MKPVTPQPVTPQQRKQRLAFRAATQRGQAKRAATKPKPRKRNRRVLS